MNQVNINLNSISFKKCLNSKDTILGFFWPISPIFEAKKVASKTPADMHNFIWVYHHGNPGKSIAPIPRKQLADDKD